MGKVESKILSGVKPFNEMSLKSCYYNQTVAACSVFEIEPQIIAGNYLPLYKFDEEDKSLDVKNSEIFNDKELLKITGVKKKYFQKINSFKSFIIKKIDQNKPIIVPVDCFYLKYREDTYRKQHISHFILVYGYDKVSNEFIINEHMYTNSLDYLEMRVSMDIVEKAYQNFVSRLMKNETKTLTILSKKRKRYDDYKQSFKISLTKKKSEIVSSQNNFCKCIDYIIDSMKNKEVCIKEQDSIIDFLGKIRWIKVVQRNVIDYVFENKEIGIITDRIVENYIFIYGMLVKFKVANFYNEKSVIKAIIRCEELKDLEVKLHRFLLGEKYE